jgi:hypothetical protein
MLFKSSNFIWPFTLNYSFNKTDCLNCDDSNKTIEALWQFPLHEWTQPNGNFFYVKHDLKRSVEV